MKLESATQVPLSVWPDPQGNPLLIVSEYRTLVYLGCWEASAVPADYVCRLAFEHGWASRSMNVEFLPYKTIGTGTSPVYEVTNSAYLRDASKWRSTVYDKWKTWDTAAYRHFVISGHDIYVEVIAKNFFEERIPVGDVKEILPLFYHDFVSK
jgi:hypothetical protein